MRLEQVKSSDAPLRRSNLTRRLRRLACALAAGVVFQTTAGGCEAQLSQTIQTLSTDAVDGIGKGITSIAEAFVLNLFI